MEEKRINKWLRHQFSVVGWVLVLYCVLMNVLVIGTQMTDIAGQYLKDFASGDFNLELDYDAIVNNATGYILTIAVGVVILWAWKGTDYWKAEVLKKEGSMRASVFFALMTLMAGIQLISGLWIEGLEAVLNLFDNSLLWALESVSGGKETVSMLLYFAFLGPVSEEILFRGFVLRSLRPYGKRFAIFGSAFLFAMFHGNLLQLPLAFLTGLVLGYCAVEYSIGWAMLLHIWNNFVLAELMTRLQELLPAPVGDILSTLVIVAFAIAAVVILIVKRREIRAYRQGEWMDRRCLKCFFLNFGVLILIIFMVINMLSMLIM